MRRRSMRLAVGLPLGFVAMTAGFLLLDLLLGELDDTSLADALELAGTVTIVLTAVTAPWDRSGRRLADRAVVPRALVTGVVVAVLAVVLDLVVGGAGIVGSLVLGVGLGVIGAGAVVLAWHEDRREARRGSRLGPVPPDRAGMPGRAGGGPVHEGPDRHR